MNNHFKLNGKIWSWIAYDMGNSVFAVTVMAGFFPVFFKSYWSHEINSTISTARLVFAVSLASLIAALCAPFLGALSDAKKSKRLFLLLFACFGLVATASLSLIPAGGWPWAIAAYCAAIFGFFGADIFYNSLLVRLVSPQQRDWVSSLGYAFGYLSGGLIFALNVAMTQAPSFFGFPDVASAVKASFLVASSTWGLGALTCYLFVPEEGPVSKSGSKLLLAWKELRQTYKNIKQYRPAWTFLLSYWLYIDVVNTLIVMAVDYGMSLGFQSQDLILALLLVQLVSFPSAILVAKLGAKIGVRNAIFICLSNYGFVCLWATLLQYKWEFFFVAGLIGLAQGGIQALSRSYFAGLIPQDQAGEFFGFYNMLGKFATILGPSLVGGVGLLAQSLFTGPSLPEHFATRVGFASLLLPLLLGGWIFLKIPNQTKAQS